MRDKAERRGAGKRVIRTSGPCGLCPEQTFKAVSGNHITEYVLSLQKELDLLNRAQVLESDL
jgi:hypothetical protein